MVNIQIGLDGVPSLRKVAIGNKYENQDEIITFELPIEFDDFNKYVISVIKVNGQKYTSILPVINNQFIVSTQLTQYAGKWSMYLMAREKTSLNLNVAPVDISAKNNEHVFISDGFIGIVGDSEIEKENIEDLTLDANLQTMYDELAKLRDELVERMKASLFSYTQLKDIPTEFNPAPHNHDTRYYTKEEMELKLSDKADMEHNHDDAYYTKLKADDLLKVKSDITHNHDEIYYGKSEINDLLSTKADSNHTHDNIYYSKLEVNKLLQNKSNTTHQHDDRYYTEDEIDAKLLLKAEAKHNHNDLYYIKSEIDTSLSSKSDLGHNHDSAYYTQSKVDELLKAKANTLHTHDDLYYAKSDTDKLLECKANTVHLHDDRYNTKDEATILLASKADVKHTHTVSYITDFPVSLPANGGNSDTVNGHTVLSNVPVSAKFTDTVYTHPETHPVSMITGLPTKLSEFENDKKYQTAEEVALTISNLVKSAPDTLDTLEELANALGNDPNFATTIITMLGEKASKTDVATKVDTIEGKGLSSNDFTTTFKDKLTSLENYNDSELRTLILDNKADVDSQLATKVTSVVGKSLTSNDFTNELKAKLISLSNYDDTKIRSDINDMQTSLGDDINARVLKEEGKGLSSNDFTKTFKDKLISLENYDDTDLRTLIKNTETSINGKLATKVSQVTGKTLTSNDFTDELKAKLESLSNYDDSALKALINDNQSDLTAELAKKVSYIAGKQLSTNDYTTAEKNKLASLNNYNDDAVLKQISNLSVRIDKIEKFVAAFGVANNTLTVGNGSSK